MNNCRTNWKELCVEFLLSTRGNFLIKDSIQLSYILKDMEKRLIGYGST